MIRNIGPGIGIGTSGAGIGTNTGTHPSNGTPRPIFSTSNKWSRTLFSVEKSAVLK
jgi:hypothetical protein